MFWLYSECGEERIRVLVLMCSLAKCEECSRRRKVTGDDEKGHCRALEQPAEGKGMNGVNVFVEFKERACAESLEPASLTPPVPGVSRSLHSYKPYPDEQLQPAAPISSRSSLLNFLAPHREDDKLWPKKNVVGKQELEVKSGGFHISFEVRSNSLSFGR